MCGVWRGGGGGIGVNGVGRKGEQARGREVTKLSRICIYAYVG